MELPSSIPRSSSTFFQAFPLALLSLYAFDSFCHKHGNWYIVWASRSSSCRSTAFLPISFFQIKISPQKQDNSSKVPTTTDRRTEKPKWTEHSQPTTEFTKTKTKLTQFSNVLSGSVAREIPILEMKKHSIYMSQGNPQEIKKLTRFFYKKVLVYKKVVLNWQTRWWNLRKFYFNINILLYH